MMAERARPNKKKKPKKKASSAPQTRARDREQVIDRAKREYVRDIETLNRETAAKAFALNRQEREVNEDAARQIEDVTEAHARRRLERLREGEQTDT